MRTWWEILGASWVDNGWWCSCIIVSKYWSWKIGKIIRKRKVKEGRKKGWKGKRIQQRYIQRRTNNEDVCLCLNYFTCERVLLLLFFFLFCKIEVLFDVLFNGLKYFHHFASRGMFQQFLILLIYGIVH
jgi:hypothetical protein